MRAGRVYLLCAFTILWVFAFAVVTASDCGCGFSTDETPEDAHSDYIDDMWSDSGDSGGSDSGTTPDSGGGQSQDGSGGSGGSSSGAVSAGSSEDSMVWVTEGRTLFEQGFYNESLAAFTNATLADPFSKLAWLGKGRALLQVGQFENATYAFRRVLRLDPSEADALVGLGDAQKGAGNFTDSIASYTMALAMNPNLATVKEKISMAEGALAASLATPTPTIVEVTMPVPPTVEETPLPPITPRPTKAAAAFTSTACLALLAAAIGAVLILKR